MSQFIERFKFNNSINIVSPRQVLLFFDSRYKELEHEEIKVLENIRSKVKNVLVEMNILGNNVEINICVQKNNSAFEFLSGDEVRDINNALIQFHCYLAEPQLKYDFDPFEFHHFKSHEKKYSLAAKKY